ncbi:T9SS type A sorting domain-containing protein [Flavobacterium sp. XGLA_31]|uniref:T9SS type A sorting domain-containing protein n=1 Tax=Flavobacterium sp. XGLA_31 TaxID=3447666 RepID=UPI003F30B9C1
MKTKLLLLSITLMSFLPKSLAQNYIPMLDNNASWNITVANFGGNTNLIIEPGVNVTIGAYTYKKIHDPFFNTDVYLREDTSTQKVYRMVNNVDQILYDFSLTNGSYITLANGITYQVTLSNINVIGGTRKQYYLHSSNMFVENEIWIEGIGNNRHPLMPTYEMFFSDPYIYLTCSAQNGVNVYNHAIANGQTTPTDCSMLLSTDNFNLHTVNFIPNPATNQLTIVSDQPFENALLSLYNSVGQLVKKINNIYGNQIIITRENLSEGIYFAQLTQNEQVTTKKIIFVH